jgi:hypothetical protein
MVTKPTINPNGTAPRVLLEQQVAVIEAMRCAISRLQSAAPHALDYQTAPVGAFTSAMDEHRDRLKRLDRRHRHCTLACVQVGGA